VQITTAGPNIKGVVLCQELPHLSHLGVRARQERVPFATCCDKLVVEQKLLPLVGSQVALHVTAEGVKVEKSTASTPAGKAAPSGDVPGAAADAAEGPKFTKAENVEKVLTSTVLPVTEATHANAGAKAAVCGVLGRLAKDYSTPRGAVLPFGSMELVVNSAGAQKEFSSCLDVLERAPVGSELDDACLSMNKLLSGCLPAEADLKELQAQLKGASIVIARSSANVEDLAGLSGAGLYESIPNLNLTDQKSLGTGIAQVWGSLYSRRAVLSRRAAGVAQSDACMGVLVQVCFQDSSMNDLNKEENRKLAMNYCNGMTVFS
jgi:phosphoglucan, water dikinase